MRRELTMRPTQRNGGGYAQDRAREWQQSPPQKRTRPSPRTSEGRNVWATLTGPPTEEQTQEKETDPGRGRIKQRGKNSRWLAASGRVTASAPAAPGHQENRQEEAEASPEGEAFKPKGQPADRGQSRVGEPGSRPTVRGAQWREPRIPQNPQPQRGTPGKRALALQGAKLSYRPRHKPQPAEKRVGYEIQPQTPSKGRGGNTTLTRDREEPWRELRWTAG